MDNQQLLLFWNIQNNVNIIFDGQSTLRRVGQYYAGSMPKGVY